MKQMLLFVPATLCLALTMPAIGHRAPVAHGDEPADTAYVDSLEDSDTLTLDGDDEAVDSMWADSTADGDSTAVDSVEAERSEVCPPDYELLGDYESHEVDYSLQNPRNANVGASFAATIYSPADAKKKGGYVAMVSRVLAASLPLEDVKEWKTADVDKMLSRKWETIKAGYQRDMTEVGEVDYTYRTTLSPAWQFKAAGGLTTYKIEDEIYLGGAHGMYYTYYLTFSVPGDSLLGLTDVFKPAALPKVFALVSDKLAHRSDKVADPEIWPEVAEVTPAPTPEDMSLRAGALEQYEGKWYPRPALTECGVVFSYQPYVKGPYAEGVIEVLLPYAEIGEYLKLKP